MPTARGPPTTNPANEGLRCSVDSTNSEVFLAVRRQHLVRRDVDELAVVPTLAGRRKASGDG